MRLLGSTKKIRDKKKTEKKSFTSVDSQYQQKSEVLYTFTSNKSHAYLSNVEPSNLVFLKTYKRTFDKIIITFTDQNG